MESTKSYCWTVVTRKDGNEAIGLFEFNSADVLIPIQSEEDIIVEVEYYPRLDENDDFKKIDIDDDITMALMFKMIERLSSLFGGVTKEDISTINKYSQLYRETIRELKKKYRSSKLYDNVVKQEKL